MRALIIGANGRVGAQLAHKLAEQGQQVFAAARKPGNHIEVENIHYTAFDLQASAVEMAEIFRRIQPDVIYFTAGSRGKNLLQVDAFGAVKTIQAAEQTGVQRFILLSSVFALQPERWGEAFLAKLTDYNIAKFFADTYLTHSNLNYTILQPGVLQESAGSGKIQTDVAAPMNNSIENVVEVLAGLPYAENTIRKVITMGDGDIPIAEALAAIS